MKSIKEIVEKSLKKKIRDEIIAVFRAKEKGHILNDQDKKHIRIMAILQFARQEGIIERIMKSQFKEEFEYDEKSDSVIYHIVFIKERRKKLHADA